MVHTPLTLHLFTNFLVRGKGDGKKNRMEHKMVNAQHGIAK